jgi:LmbE family N-acetylglucosaminyl deacetylase
MTKRLLAILAHPDDESFGTGGTLAKYAAEGADVHVAIATDGAAGSVAEGHEDKRERLTAVREQELAAAAKILGVTLHNLGYRDSGYIGDPANEHPDAFIQADEYEAIGRVVKLIREIRPQVIITHDETGGYFHPDHIFCWKITTPAFHAAGDPAQYPELGLPPYQSERLYYTAFSNRSVKIFTFMMRLRRQDPTKAGRNKDVDFTQLGMPPEKITTYIDYRLYWDVKGEASAQHASQGGGMGGRNALFPRWLQRRIFGRETYMRAYPPVSNGSKEYDLFGNIQ